jgi:hypothetical protein
MYIRALRATLNKTDHSYNSVSLPTSQLKSFVVIPAWLKIAIGYKLLLDRKEAITVLGEVLSK